MKMIPDNHFNYVLDFTKTHYRLDFLVVVNCSDSAYLRLLFPQKIKESRSHWTIWLQLVLNSFTYDFIFCILVAWSAFILMLNSFRFFDSAIFLAQRISITVFIFPQGIGVQQNQRMKQWRALQFRNRTSAIELKTSYLCNMVKCQTLTHSTFSSA